MSSSDAEELKEVKISTAPVEVSVVVDTPEKKSKKEKRRKHSKKDHHTENDDHNMGDDIDRRSLSVIKNFCC